MPPPPKPEAKPKPPPACGLTAVLRLDGIDYPCVIHRVHGTAYECHVQVFCQPGRYATYHHAPWSATPTNGAWRWPDV